MADDFPTSPSKRRRTESPVDQMIDPPPPSIPGLHLSEPPVGEGDKMVDAPAGETVQTEGAPNEASIGVPSETAPGLLDMLMAQVEAQARDAEPEVASETIPEAEVQRALPAAIAMSEAMSKEDQSGPHWAEVAETLRNEQRKQLEGLEGAETGLVVEEQPLLSGMQSKELEVHQKQQAPDTDPSLPTVPDVEQLLRDQHPAHVDGTEAIMVDSLPPSDQPQPNGQPAEKEWETDSSPYSSSTDSSSDDSSDEDSDDGDNDYALLSATEQARILMDDAGSDDEGGKSKGTGSVVKTTNEKFEEVIPKPDITITAEMKIEELGNVEGIVESTVLIKGRTTAEYQVLESGSLLCLRDRSVIGVVAEPLGRVEQPLYTVRFTNDEAIKEAGVAEKGTTIYYVHEHSKFVFTQPLKGLKGSDASNFHDEEVGDEEMEFSDDEKEAEHKRLLKLRKKGIDPDSSRGGRGAARGGRGGRGRGRGGFQPALPPHPENAIMGGGEAVGLNYDEGEITEYEPLRRPGTMESQQATQETEYQPAEPQPEYAPPRFQQDGNRRGFQQRGRGQGGRGRGGRGGRGQFPAESRSASEQLPTKWPAATEPARFWLQSAAAAELDTSCTASTGHASPCHSSTRPHRTA